jgi:hypothetical protein
LLAQNARIWQAEDITQVPAVVPYLIYPGAQLLHAAQAEYTLPYGYLLERLFAGNLHIMQRGLTAASLTA